MTVNGSLTYTHYDCNTGEWHTVGETQFNDALRLWRNIIVYKAVNPCYCFFIRPSFTVVLLIVKEV